MVLEWTPLGIVRDISVLSSRKTDVGVADGVVEGDWFVIVLVGLSVLLDGDGVVGDTVGSP